MINIQKQLSIVTQDVHERLHVHPMLENLLSEKIQEDDYGAVLCAFRHFYIALSHQITTAGFKIPHVIQSSINNLDRDLHDLNISDIFEPCMIKTRIRTQDDLYGLLYVIEGSHLGGQFIAKNIRRVFGFENNRGVSFFSGHGKETAKHWKIFLKDLEASVCDHEQCCLTAQSVFEDLERYLWTIWNTKNTPHIVAHHHNLDAQIESSS